MRTGNSGLPPYLRAAQVLRERIRSGEYAPGRRLPSEAELAADLGVAKGTLRKALALLREEGAIETYHGFGSRVTPPGG